MYLVECRCSCKTSNVIYFFKADFLLTAGCYKTYELSDQNCMIMIILRVLNFNRLILNERLRLKTAIGIENCV